MADNLSLQLTRGDLKDYKKQHVMLASSGNIILLCKPFHIKAEKN
jgi:hypothetical protein